MNFDHAHPGQDNTRPIAGFLPDLPATIFYFVVIGSFAVFWAVLRAYFGVSFLAALALVAVPFGLIIWFHKTPPDESPPLT